MRQTQLRNKSRTPHRQRQCPARHIFPKSFENICAERNYTTRVGGTKDPEGSADIDKIVFSHLTKSDAEIISLIGFRSQGNIGTFPTKNS